MTSNVGGYASIIFLDNEYFIDSKNLLQKQFLESKKQKCDFVLDMSLLDKAVILKGSIRDTTNNKMELLAYLNAIRYLDNLNNSGFKIGNTRIKIYTDSSYIANNLKSKNISIWEKNNWKTKNRTNWIGYKTPYDIEKNVA